MPEQKELFLQDTSFNPFYPEKQVLKWHIRSVLNYVKILKDEHKFVLSTHTDKGHIHNHIIFNNVNMVTGKCYQST